MKNKSLLIWVILRLPILAAGLYLFRDNLAILIERYFNLGLVIESFVYIISTAWIRLILYIVCALGLAAGYHLATKWTKRDVSRYILFLLVSGLAMFISFQSLLRTQSSLMRTIIVLILLAVNTMPLTWLNKVNLRGGFLNFAGIAGLGVDEALFPQMYFLWLAEKFQPKGYIRQWSWLAGILIAPLAWVFLLTPYNNQRILTLGERLHTNPAVEKFGEGGYNWIEYNPEHHLLYTAGHNVNYLMAYDTEHLEQPPRKTTTRVGKPQSFAFNPDLQELYVYKADTQELLYLDAVTLDVLRSVPVPDLSPGDVWVNWQRGTDSIIIASEADREVGTPTVMVDRASGKIIAEVALPHVGTNVAFDSENNIFYFTSFRDTYLVAWDMIQHKILRQVETSPRTDRLVYYPKAHEVLVASTQEGAILRYDADTLEYKGRIDASLGDRTLTLDSKRNLLLVGNFISNYMQIIDLNTGQRIGRFYIGPWIRTIAIDEEAGVAFVSTAEDLFKVKYIKQEQFR